MSVTNILPSPTLPVFDAPTMASMTWSTSSFLTATSIRVFGTKSTTYSAPRYSSVWPRCRPNPLTSVTVMPETPISERAARTSSSLKGLMMAVINFIIDSGQRWAVTAILLRLQLSGTRCSGQPLGGLEVMVAQRQGATRAMFGVAIHGGAGTLPRAEMEREAELKYRAGLQEAIDAAFAVLMA